MVQHAIIVNLFLNWVQRWTALVQPALSQRHWFFGSCHHSLATVLQLINLIIFYVTIQQDTTTQSLKYTDVYASHLAQSCSLPTSGNSTSSYTWESAALLQSLYGILKTLKHLVFESELNKLIKQCSDCGSIITDISNTVTGSALSISYSCILGHNKTWHSQPLIHHMPASNHLELSRFIY